VVFAGERSGLVKILFYSDPVRCRLISALRMPFSFVSCGASFGSFISKEMIVRNSATSVKVKLGNLLWAKRI
jgi:hypothetical protein